MSYASERPIRSQAIYDRDSIESRRQRLGISATELAQRARTPITRTHFILCGKFTADEVGRINHVLAALELERS